MSRTPSDPSHGGTHDRLEQRLALQERKLRVRSDSADPNQTSPTPAATLATFAAANVPGGSSCSGSAYVTEENTGIELAKDAGMGSTADVTFTDPTIDVCGGVAQITGGKLEVLVEGWYLAGGDVWIDQIGEVTYVGIGGQSYGEVYDFRYWGPFGDVGYGTTPHAVGGGLIYCQVGDLLAFAAGTSYTGGGTPVTYRVNLWIARIACGCAAPEGVGGGGGGE